MKIQSNKEEWPDALAYIAAELDASKTTAHRDASCSGEPPDSPEQPEKVRGLDDKQYPAKALPPEEIDARAERILEQKKEGKTVKEIAKKEKVSTGTPHDAETRARMSESHRKRRGRPAGP